MGEPKPIGQTIKELADSFEALNRTVTNAVTSMETALQLRRERSKREFPPGTRVIAKGGPSDGPRATILEWSEEADRVLVSWDNPKTWNGRGEAMPVFVGLSFPFERVSVLDVMVEELDRS